MEAALARDIEKTGALIEEHIRKTADNVRQWFVAQDLR